MYENNHEKKEEVAVVADTAKKVVKTKVEKLNDSLKLLEAKRKIVENKRSEEDKVYNDKVDQIKSDIEVEEDKNILEAIKKAKKEGKDLSYLGI